MSQTVVSSLFSQTSISFRLASACPEPLPQTKIVCSIEAAQQK